MQKMVKKQGLAMQVARGAHTPLERAVGSVQVARGAGPWRAARPRLYIWLFCFSAPREKEARVLKGVFPISSLGLRGSSLRLFLVFGTPFFHLVITID
jgi:hypothetical protein